MFGFFRKRNKTQTDAYAVFEQGQQAGAAISEDAMAIVDRYCDNLCDQFLQVFDQRLAEIVPVEGVTLQEQARIELQVMWENWNKQELEHETQIWSKFWEKWGQVVSQLGVEDEARKLISSRLSWHSVELFSQGVEHSANALEHRQKSK